MSTAKIVLTPEEHAELTRRVSSATISQRDGRRACVILFPLKVVRGLKLAG